jgi:hypothetical protein
MQAWARLTTVLAFSAAAAAATAAEDVGAAVRACRGESDAVARLACYDRAVDRAQQPAVNAAPAPKAAAPAAAAATGAPAAAAPAAAAKTVEDNFGRERQIQAQEQKRQQEEARALGELEATVTRIETRMDGLMTITLDNGQVWRQNTPDAKFRLKEGDHVRIQPGSMNSFILSGPTKKSTRVSRVN